MNRNAFRKVMRNYVREILRQAMLEHAGRAIVKRVDKEIMGDTRMQAKAEIQRLQAKLESGDMQDNEPLFVLRGRDSCAMATIDFWLRQAEAVGCPEAKLKEARELRNAVATWPIKQRPGQPETRQGIATQPSVCKPVYTVAEAVNEIKQIDPTITYKTVTRLFDSGRLRGYRIPGSQDRRIYGTSLDAFMNEMRQDGEESVNMEPESADELISQIGEGRMRCVVQNLKRVGRFAYRDGGDEDPHPMDQHPMDAPLWARLAHVFGIGKTRARTICEVFDEDPDWREPAIDPLPLQWAYDGDQWVACSNVHDGGNPFEWRIAVCEDGTFCVNESDAELTQETRCLQTLKLAQQWCQERETKLCSEAR